MKYSGKTLFVLGAGSSKEVHMPTGPELKQRIIDSLTLTMDGNRMVATDQTMFQVLQSISPASTFAPGGPVEASQRIRRGLVTARSIDNLLEAHMEDMLAVRVGKAAICRAILEAERNSLLASPKTGQRPDLEPVAETWYGKFHQLIVDGTKFDRLAEKLSRILVVTFNYDRTLEHFLLYALTDYYGVQVPEVAQVLTNLKIVHPYGTVGTLPWQGPDYSVEYGGEVSSTDLVRLSEKIVTFSEGSEAKLAIDWQQTRRVVFLGFAYHQINIAFLFPDIVLPRAERRVNPMHIYGSAKGISESNQEEIRMDLVRIFGADSQIAFLNATCGKFLDDFWNALLIRAGT